MSKLFDLTGKVAIVTGAAGGLGRAFSLALAEAGARVVAADMNGAGAAETAVFITQNSGEAIPVAVNVTDPASVSAMVEQAVAQFGRLDILINNAAIYATIERKPFWEIDPSEWDRVLAVNLKGAWLCSRAVFPALAANPNGGKIIHIASATFFSGSPNWSHYVASKGGIIGLTRSMAREAGDYGVTVNAIAPGFTLTEASLGLMENAAAYGVNRGAIKRSQSSDDLLGTLLYLASPASDFVTGQTLVVDGGRQFN